MSIGMSKPRGASGFGAYRAVAEHAEHRPEGIVGLRLKLAIFSMNASTPPSFSRLACSFATSGNRPNSK